MEMIKKLYTELMKETKKQIEDVKHLMKEDEYNELIYEIDMVDKECQKDNPDKNIIDLRSKIIGLLGDKL